MLKQLNMNKIAKKCMKPHFYLVAALCMTSTNIFAQDKLSEGKEASPLSPLYSCSKIKNDSERLKCYDEAVGIIEKKEENKEVVAIDAPKLEEIRKQSFGFKMPALPKLSFPKIGKNGEQVIEEKQAMIASRVGRFGGSYAIIMENGQIWQLVEGDEPLLPKKPPVNVIIRSASMGSYILSFEGFNKGYRVRRVE